MGDNLKHWVSELERINYELGYQDGRYSFNKKAMPVKELLDERDKARAEIDKLLKTVRAICI